MKYYVETWEDNKELGNFGSEGEREKWIDENCYINENGGFLKATGEKISIFEV